MFKVTKLEKFEDFYLLQTCNSIMGRPLMWVYFLQFDNVFIDTGNATRKISLFKKFIKEKNHKRNWVILNSHYHEDHCGNNKIIKDELNAKILVPHKKDNFDDVYLLYRIYWRKPKPFDCDTFTSDVVETDKGRKITLIPTPGHTPCHVSFFIEPYNVLYTGDVIPLASNKMYCMREENYCDTIETMKKLKNIITKDMTVITAHMALLPDPIDALNKRIDNMEKIVMRVKEAWQKYQTIEETRKAVFGKRTPYTMLYDFLVEPRMSLDYTIQSILFKQ